MKILVVDDDPVALETLSAQLGALGCAEVSRCDGARDAWQAIEENRSAAELILCDLHMPVHDGVELVRHLARLGYAGKLVLLSGTDRRILRGVERLALSHGLNIVAALAKPVSLAELRDVLDRAAETGPAQQTRRSKGYSAGELGRAIADGELVNHYQPQVDLRSGALVAVEALVRWQHRRDGLVYPDRFIGAAERHGLIDPLTRSVLRDAVRQLRDWRAAGIDIDVSVNVSMDNLTVLRFPDFVASELNRFDVPTDALVLEVTESRLMSSPTRALDVLTRLRLKDVGLAIDDFGTGHSSLAQLRDVPFNELKLDRSFIHLAAQDPALRPIVEASLAMARQLGMRSVAEGVEDEVDWHFVRDAGCSAAQGWLIGKPMPAEELPRWLESWKQRHHALTSAAPFPERRARVPEVRTAAICGPGEGDL